MKQGVRGRSPEKCSLFFGVGWTESAVPTGLVSCASGAGCTWFGWAPKTPPTLHLLRRPTIDLLTLRNEACDERTLDLLAVRHSLPSFSCHRPDPVHRVLAPASEGIHAGADRQS